MLLRFMLAAGLVVNSVDVHCLRSFMQEAALAHVQSKFKACNNSCAHPSRGPKRWSDSFDISQKELPLFAKIW